MRIDAHQHIWQRTRGDYDWLTPALAPLWRDFLPADLAPKLARHGITGTVLVQAAPTLAETAFMLAQARAHPFIRGVVGWTDFSAPDAPARIAVLGADPLIIGLRPMLQDLHDDDAILRPAVQPALAAMAAHGMALDALIRPRHLPRLLTLRDRHPDLKIVIDHAGKPAIAAHDLSGWTRDLTEVAADGLTHCKLSGLITEAGADWQVADLQPVADTMLAAFGPGRVMWGSDWPVLNLAGDYHRWVSATDALLAGLDSPARAAVWGGTAMRFYGLEDR